MSNHRIASPSTAAALAAGGLITAVGGAVAQVVRASTDVPEELFRYPWTSDAFIAASLLWALSHALLLVGLLGVRRSAGAAGDRGLRAGLTVAAIGLVMFVAAELASLPVVDERSDSGAAGLTGALFGLATLVTGVGLTVAGRAATRLWHGPRRFVLLACGVWALLLLGLVMTPVMQIAIGVWGALFLVLAGAVGAPAPGRSTAGSSIALR